MLLNYANQSTGYSSYEVAKSIATSLQSNDSDGWRYVAIKPELSNFWFIEIYDENNEFVARYSSRVTTVSKR